MGSCCYILGNLREFMAVSLLSCTIMPLFLGFVSSLCLIASCFTTTHSAFVGCFSPESAAARWFYCPLSLLFFFSFLFYFYFHGTISFFLSCELVCFFSFFCLLSFICCLHVSSHFHFSFMFFFFISTNAALGDFNLLIMFLFSLWFPIPPLPLCCATKC